MRVKIIQKQSFMHNNIAFQGNPTGVESLKSEKLDLGLTLNNHLRLPGGVSSNVNVILGSVDALESITMRKMDKQDKVGKLVLKSPEINLRRTFFCPRKIKVFLEDLKGFELHIPKGADNLLKKFKFIDMNTAKSVAQDTVKTFVKYI